jgi:antitoxin VapB
MGAKGGDFRHPTSAVMQLHLPMKYDIYYGIYRDIGGNMKTAKLFSNDRSQAVRLPKEFQFQGKDVLISKFENVVMLFPKDDPWAPLVGSLDRFSKDFMQSRKQPKQQKRESFE